MPTGWGTLAGLAQGLSQIGGQIYQQATDPQLIAQRQTQERQKTVESIAQEFPKPEDAIGALRQRGFITEADALESKLWDTRKKRADVMKVESETWQNRLEQASGIAKTIMDQASLDAARQKILPLMGPQIAQLLPETFDPAAIQQLSDMTLTESERLARFTASSEHAKRLADVARDKGRDSREAAVEGTKLAAQLLSVAGSQQDWDTTLQMLQQAGVSPAVIQQFGAQWSPEAQQRAGQMGIAPDERAQMERDAARDAETRRHNLATERSAAISASRAGAAEPLVAIVGPDGKPVYAPRSQAIGKTPATGSQKPATGLEKRALNFFNRAQQADKDLEAIEGEIAELGLAGQARLAWAPNFAQTETGQLYDQAQRAFTEARLRKDSGAAIPDSEFENDRKTYFVQPGDDPATIEQKRRARAAILSSLGFESGQALGEFVGDADEAKTIVDTYRQRSQRADGGQGAGPRVGERRTINGQLGEWDGKGWKPVQ